MVYKYINIDIDKYITILTAILWDYLGLSVVPNRAWSRFFQSTCHPFHQKCQ